MSNRLALRTSAEGLLQCWQRDPQPFEALDRSQGANLQQALGEAVPTPRVRNQYHLAAVSLHGAAALAGVKLFVDGHDRRQVVASRQLGHEPVNSRLGAGARRAGRDL